MPDTWLAERRQPRDSLATRLIFFVFLSTFVTSLVVSWVSVHSTYSFLRRELEHGHPAFLRQREETLVRDVGLATALLRHLRAEPSLRRFAEGAGDRSEAERLLLDHLQESGVVTRVLVRDGDGRVRLRVGSPEPSGALEAASPATADGVRVVAGELVVASLFRGPGDRVLGSLEGALARSAFSPEALPPAGAALYLVDGDGRVLLGASPGGAPPASFPMAAAASPGPLFEFRDAENRRGLGAYRRLPFADWGLVTAQPFEQAYAPVFSVLTRIFVIDLAVVLLFSFLAYEITSAIVRPLEALSDAARRISQGELEVEIADTRKHDEIGLLTRTFNDMARRLRRNHGELDQQHRRLREQNEQLHQANEVLEQLSITDGLTKLHNHRYFQETLTREIKRVTRTREPLAMLLVDIDDFKALNDRLGHAAGDAVLVRIARILNESVRESDVLARYGGEEFVVLATGTDLAGALFLAEKVRTAVAESAFGVDPAGEPMRVTVSVGVAGFTGDRRGFFDAADRALYRAKAAGKNCVLASGSDRPVS
jgi:diguanylate cyclase (GGDEF)-like protein